MSAPAWQRAGFFFAPLQYRWGTARRAGQGRGRGGATGGSGGRIGASVVGIALAEGPGYCGTLAHRGPGTGSQQGHGRWPAVAARGLCRRAACGLQRRCRGVAGSRWRQAHGGQKPCCRILTTGDFNVHKSLHLAPPQSHFDSVRFSSSNFADAWKSAVSGGCL